MNLHLCLTPTQLILHSCAADMVLNCQDSRESSGGTIGPWNDSFAALALHESPLHLCLTPTQLILHPFVLSRAADVILPCRDSHESHSTTGWCDSLNAASILHESVGTGRARQNHTSCKFTIKGGCKGSEYPRG